MIKLEGDISNIKTTTPYDFLKWAGLVNSLHSGFLFYLPLGKLFKDRIIDRVKKLFSSYGYNFIELQEYVPKKSISDFNDFRLCSRLKTENGEYWYNDPLIDAKIVQSNVKYNNVFWVKKYADTSLRVKLSKLRLHSYELITILATTNTILPTIKEVLENLFVNQVQVLFNAKDIENDFVVAIKFQDEIFKIGHCNQPDCLDSLFVAGISIEKLLSLIVRINIVSEKQIETVNKYLINTVKGLNYLSNEYDVFDDRNCSVKEKQIRAKALGVREIYITKNNNKIQDKYEIKQIGC